MNKFNIFCMSMLCIVSLSSTATYADNHCDALTLNKHDTQAETLTVKAVDWDDIDTDAAIAACTQAVKDSPQTRRYVYQLGRAYYKAENYETARVHLLKAAEQDYAVAMMALGLMYEGGEGVPESIDKAIEWHSKAAKLGNYESQLALVDIYQESDPDKANKLLNDILKNGTAKAQRELGEYYYDNDQEKKAFEVASIAAKRGNKDALYDVGYAYENGEGVEQSYEQAAAFYEKAVAKKQVDAMVNLGSLYDEGKGVTQSFKKAYALYKQAADEGDVDAYYNLGVMHEDGEGVKKSKVMAIKWYRKAAELGDEEAAEAIQELLKQ